MAYPYDGYPYVQQAAPDQLAMLRQQQMPQRPAVPLWVQGEAGAKAYPVAPNSSVILMDSENNVFYIKSADASGMPMMRTFDYTERAAAQNQAAQAALHPNGDYVTRAEFAALAAKFEALMQPAAVTVTKEGV